MRDRKPPATTRKVARSASGSQTNNVLVPPRVLIILGKATHDGDSFTVIGSKGAKFTKKTSDAKPLDPTHDAIALPLKGNPKSPQTYTLEHKRGSSTHVVFTKVPYTMLSLDGEKPPDQQRKQKQHFVWVVRLADAKDKDLNETLPVFGKVTVKEPTID